MALSATDKEKLSASDQAKISSLTAAWNAANKAGDKAKANSIHAQAEAIRAGSGYSGGADGSRNIAVSSKSSTPSSTSSKTYSSGRNVSSSTSKSTSSGGSTGTVLYSGAGGNAPADTQIGDLVVTGGGTYMRVAPNTAGATYNPTSGFWSVKVNDSTTAPQQPYTSLGDWHDKGLSTDDRAKMDSLTSQWYAAQARGDQAGMNAAHNAAEAIRAKYGYSGGSDGSMYIPIEMEEDILPKVGLPTYQPQTAQVNSVYDAAKNASLAALQSSYNNSKLELERYANQIPGIYQKQANAVAAQAEMDRQKFNEYSAQSGLNAGNGSQASLAMNNQLQNNLAQIRTSEANATAEAQYKLSALYTEYQGKIASAIANNEYERAAALLAEYKEQQQSIVSVAQAQSQLDLNIANYNKDTKFTNYQKQVALAEALAAQGDFSGYRALGLSEDQINSMKRGWLAQNPEAAFSLGYR